MRVGGGSEAVRDTLGKSPVICYISCSQSYFKENLNKGKLQGATQKPISSAKVADITGFNPVQVNMYLATHGNYCNSYPAAVIPHLTTQDVHASEDGS